MPEYTGWDSYSLERDDSDLVGKLEYILKNHGWITTYHWVRRTLTGEDDNLSYDISKDDYTYKQYGDSSEDISDRDNDSYCWLLDEYRHYSYEGEGERIGIRKSDGQLVYGFTSHCSCDGPWEDGSEDLKIAESTNKLLDVDINDLSNVNWGPQFVKNVNWLYNHIKSRVEWKPDPNAVVGGFSGSVY